MVDQKRDYFRLEYPYEYRPILLHQDRQYQVVNISEYGVKFRTDDVEQFDVGQQLKAEIVFHDQQRYPCHGEVIRMGSRSVVLQLEQPVPLHKIRSEHILLINRFSNKYD